MRDTHVLKALRFFEESQYWSIDRIRDWQLNRLKLILNHAYSNTSFYHKRFTDISFHPKDFMEFEDIEKIPILTKQDLKKHAKEMVATNFRRNEIHESTTGGTTADYTIFYRDNESLNFKLAATLRHDRWCGWDVGEKEAIIWPASIDFTGKETWKGNVRNFILDRKLRIYAGVLDEEILNDICNRLQKFKPVMIRGFPNPISIVAEYIKGRGRFHISPQGIKSVGEPISLQQRQLLESVFGCRVFNYYLSRESGTIASECEEHDKMHVSAECLYLEFIRDGKAVKYGEPGNIVVTDLYNFGMPLIRYQIGDIGVPLNNSCKCGRNLPLMEMTAGRESDFLISPYDRSLVMGLSLLVPFVENPKVGQLQIIQDKIDHIILRIAKNKEFQEEDLALFKKTVENMFHGTMALSIEWVDEILHEQSGKFRFAIRKI